MGEELLGIIAEATGLPQELVRGELLRLLSAAGKTPAEIGIEDLRSILADYVQDVLLAAKENFASEAREG